MKFLPGIVSIPQTGFEAIQISPLGTDGVTVESLSLSRSAPWDHEQWIPQEVTVADQDSVMNNLTRSTTSSRETVRDHHVRWRRSAPANRIVLHCTNAFETKKRIVIACGLLKILYRTCFVL